MQKSDSESGYAGHNGLERRLVVPVWASDIRVEKQGDALVIHGIQPSWPTPIDKGHLQFEVLDFLSDFERGRSLARSQSRNAPHFQFANAGTEEEQIRFVKSFGPVLAKSVENPASMLEDQIIAHQDLQVLKVEQRVYSCVFEQIRTTTALGDWPKRAFRLEMEYERAMSSGLEGLRYAGNFPRRDEDFIAGAKHFNSYLARHGCLSNSHKLSMENLSALLKEIRSLIEHYPPHVFWEEDEQRPWKIDHLAFCTERELSYMSVLDIFRTTHAVLCEIFNNFPPRLYPDQHRLHELPEVRASGIRGALYYLLRMEYQYRRKIDLCANPSCGQYFVGKKAGTVYCSAKCKLQVIQRRQRNRLRRGD